MGSFVCWSGSAMATNSKIALAGGLGSINGFLDGWIDDMFKTDLFSRIHQTCAWNEME